MMNEVMTAIVDKLSTDLTLLNMIAANKPWHDKNGPNSNINSMIPAEVISVEMLRPFLSFKEGGVNRVGYIMKDASIYIRCYNDNNKTGVEINNILDRVKHNLDFAELGLTTIRQVELRWEGCLPLLPDEAYNLKYREDRYRIYLL